MSKKTMTMADLLKTHQAFVHEPDPNRLARFNKETLEIFVYEDLEDPLPAYPVDLEQMRNSAELLDWIYQIRGKSWCTPQVMHDFLEEVERCCFLCFGESTQGIFCPFGKDRKVDWKNGNSEPDESEEPDED